MTKCFSITALMEGNPMVCRALKRCASDRHVLLGGRYDGYLCSETPYLRLILIGLATRMHLEICACNLTATATDRSVHFFQYIGPNLMPKWPQMKQNYTANMIMNVSGTLRQLIYHFPGKQGLAINPTWTALKSKQHICILTSSADQCRFSSCTHLGLLQST